MNSKVPKYLIRHIAVVLFSYDERDNLLRLLRRIHNTLKQIIPDSQLQYAICVQGTDGTLDEAKLFSKEVDAEAKVYIYHTEQPLGVGMACVKAFEQVHGLPDAYLMMDCDCNHQPEELPIFLEKIEKNTVVVGSRFCPGGKTVGLPTWKLVFSVIFNHLTSFILKIPVRDKTSGYRLIAYSDTPEIAKQVAGKGFDFYIEFLFRMWMRGLNVVEVPICFLVRTKGVSKMRISNTIVDYVRLTTRLYKIKKYGQVNKSAAS